VLLAGDLWLLCSGLLSGGFFWFVSAVLVLLFFLCGGVWLLSARGGGDTGALLRSLPT
jgi:hypothetical protein